MSREFHGIGGLIDSRPCPENHKLRTPQHIENKTKPLEKHEEVKHKINYLWAVDRFNYA